MLFYYATPQMYNIIISTVGQLIAEHKDGKDREFLVWDGHFSLWNDRDKAQNRRLIEPEQSQQDAVLRDTGAQAVVPRWPSCGCRLLQPEKWRDFRGLGAEVVRFRIFDEAFLLDRLKCDKEQAWAIPPWQLKSCLCTVSFIGRAWLGQNLSLDPQCPA